MPAITTAIVSTVLACAAILPGCGALVDDAVETPPPAPIEHVIYSGDSIDISPPDILTVRGGTEAECADMGGTWQVIVIGEDGCYDVDY